MSQDFRTAQQQVKKMTQTKARSEGKLAEQWSDEDWTSQISAEKTALKKVIEQLRRPELREESELESSKESDTAKVADVKI